MPSIRLTKESLALHYPVLFGLQTRLMDADPAKAQTVSERWKENYIYQPGWVHNLHSVTAQASTICMRENHMAGGGCKHTGCSYDHVCLLCGEQGHGLWHRSPEGTFQCKEHRNYVKEQELADLDDDEIEVIIRDSRKVHPTKSATKPRGFDAAHEKGVPRQRSFKPCTSNPYAVLDRHGTQDTGCDSKEQNRPSKVERVRTHPLPSDPGI
jgi:hypothetical protein